MNQVKCYAVQANTDEVEFNVVDMGEVAMDSKYMNMALDRGMAIGIPEMPGMAYCPNGSIQAADDGQALYINGVLAPGAIFSAKKAKA